MRLGLMINHLYSYARAPRKKKDAFDSMQFLQYNNILHYLYNNLIIVVSGKKTEVSRKSYHINKSS